LSSKKIYGVQTVILNGLYGQCGNIMINVAVLICVRTEL